MENLETVFFFSSSSITETIVKQTQGRAVWRRCPGSRWLSASQINIVILQLSNQAPSYLLDIYDG